MPGIAAARAWRLSAPANTTGTMTFRVINPVEAGTSGATGLTSPTSETIGTLSSVTVTEGGNYLRAAGTMTAEAVNRFSGCRIGLFAIAPGEDFNRIRDGEIGPVATMAVSMKYDFKLPLSADDGAEAAKQYLVLIMDELDEAGELILVGRPHFVSNPGALAPGGESNTSVQTAVRPDGVISDELSAVTASGAGFTVVELDCGRLQSEGGVGTLYKANGMYRYYNSAYLAELDAKIRTLSAGCEVVLRLVMTAEHRDEALTCAPEQDGVQYYALTAAGGELCDNLCMLAGFLASRYAPGGENGTVSGMILGRGADRPETEHYAGEMSRAENVALYADTLRVLYTGAAAENPAIRMYAALSDDLSTTPPAAGGSTALLFADALSAAMAARGACDWSLCFSGSADPFTPGDAGRVSAASLELLTQYLTEIDDRTSCGAAGVMYLLNPAPGEEADLREAYIYSLLRFAASETVDRFAVCLDDPAVRAALLPVLSDPGYFDAFVPEGRLAAALAGEKQTVGELTARLAGERLRRFRFNAADGLPDSVIGAHDYFDFTASYDTGGWVAGENCTGLSSVPDGERRLLAASLATSGGEGYMGFLYRFAYSENFSVAPYVSVDLDLPADSTPQRVTIVFGCAGKAESGIGTTGASGVTGTAGSRAEFTAQLTPGANRVICDLTGYADRDAVDYIRIVLQDGGEDCVLRLAGVTGHSSYYTSESLSAVIEDSRKQAQAAGEQNGPGGTALTVALLALAVFTVAVVLMLSRKKHPADREPPPDPYRR